MTVSENPDNLYNTGIRPILDEFLLKESKKKRDYGEYWSASSAGYCMRKTIFERLGVPQVVEDARKQRIFSAGHAFHSWIQELTKKAGVSIEQETELIDDGLMVKGHFDDLVRVNDNLIVYDYKTANSKWFSYANKKPMSHYYRMQLGTYMYMLRKDPKYKDLREGRAYKISKDDLRQHEYQLLWTSGLEKDVVEYWKTINGYWKQKKLPRCTCADFDDGFMAKETWNPFFYEGEPCSLAWFAKEGVDGWS